MSVPKQKCRDGKLPSHSSAEWEAVSQRRYGMHPIRTPTVLAWRYADGAGAGAAASIAQELHVGPNRSHGGGGESTSNRITTGGGGAALGCEQEGKQWYGWQRV
ncbi:hypothetical protein MAPG_02209 [Magnaporthiopsis poae ATCC 64411]|uniref:Uncharacterized protein n=1 Tax=Magnaporthiopsis poae (strain ATCC 64411 / 73-15) TaxID=644358 RepID=A0A0C4DQR3_MAGP6|nr:hypothetical protein MAPG_02209 [Magnaporthiopsis poae ATCC 64411]